MFDAYRHVNTCGLVRTIRTEPRAASIEELELAELKDYIFVKTLNRGEDWFVFRGLFVKEEVTTSSQLTYIYSYKNIVT